MKTILSGQFESVLSMSYYKDMVRCRDHVSEGILFDIGYADKITPALAVPENLFPMEQEQDKLIFEFL